MNITLLKNNIEKAARYDFENNKVFGSAYCVIQGNDMIYKKCFGTVSADSTHPVTENTKFRMASMTKPITAAAILILIERGLLSLDDKVSGFLPEFKDIRITQITQNGLTDLGKAQNEITVCNLLTHTSGIGSEPLKEQKMTYEDRKSIDSAVEFYSRIGLDFDPGTKQQYSPFAAFDVLAKIIEKVSGTNYHDFLKREIFEPCGMVNTTFTPTLEQWNAMIAMHNKVNGKNCDEKMNEDCVFSDFPKTHYLGGAGLVSTLADYSKFAKMLLNKGKTPTKQIIGEDILRLMHTPFVSEEIMPSSERWGLGVRVIVREDYENLPLGAFGWSGAYGTHFWIDPANNIAAVYMKNSLFDGGAGNESARNFEKAVNDSLIHS